MAALTTGLMALSLGMTAASTYSNYKSQKQAAKGAERLSEYEAGMIEQNAGIMDERATDARARGKKEEIGYRAQVRQLKGKQRTSIAAQGIDLGSGSAALIQSETDLLGELDAMTIRNNAAREAWGFEVEATDLRNRATLTRAGGKAQAQSYRNQATGTLLAGVSNIAGTLYNSGLTVPRGRTASTSGPLGGRARGIQPGITPHGGTGPPRVTVRGRP